MWELSYPGNKSHRASVAEPDGLWCVPLKQKATEQSSVSLKQTLERIEPLERKGCRGFSLPSSGLLPLSLCWLIEAGADERSKTIWEVREWGRKRWRSLVPSSPCPSITQRPPFRQHVLRILPLLNGVKLGTKPSTQTSLGILKGLAGALPQLHLVRYFQHALLCQLFTYFLEKVKLCVFSPMSWSSINSKARTHQWTSSQSYPGGLVDFLTS